MPSSVKAHSCRFCPNSPLYRSHRRGLVDWLVTLMGRRPMRCDLCKRRFYL